jgi:ring-1,2-phenylacetyl-CoA epoxidase subunit PaaD
VNEHGQLEAIKAALATVPDPELPCSILDLGLVEHIALEAGRVCIQLLPTFTGCPALDMIAEDVRTTIGALPGIDICDVEWVFTPPWSTDRITDNGRTSLQAHGVTVPEHGPMKPAGDGTTPLRTSAIPCPWCGSANTRLESPFGPTRCRTIQYCDDCQNTFEDMKRLSGD